MCNSMKKSAFGAVLVLVCGLGFLSCGETKQDTSEGEDAGVQEDVSGLDVATADLHNGADSEPQDTVNTDTPSLEDTTLDSGPEPTPTTPTWWQCRKAFLQQSLDDAMKGVCDELHTTPSTEILYGIRWVFIDVVEDEQAWINERLAAIEKFYAPTKMRFHTSSVVSILNPVVEIGASETETFTVEELTTDIAQHLELDTMEADEVLAALKSRLTDDGVDPAFIQDLSLNTAFSPQDFYPLMARARSTELHIIIFDQIKPGAGLNGSSSPPGHDPSVHKVSVVNMRSDDSISVGTLPHELGHFFGQAHPHAEKTNNAAEVEFKFTNHMNKNNPFKEEVIAAAESALGPSLEGSFTDFPAYNLPTDDLVQWQKVRYAHTKFAVDWLYTYRNTDLGMENFESLRDFIDAGLGDETIYRKNHTQKSPPKNNCMLDESIDRVTCTLGDPPQTLQGDHQLLDGSILLEDGYSVNIMSYIGKTLSPTFEDPRMAFIPEQIEVMNLHADTPVRQMLRNYLK